MKILCVIPSLRQGGAERVMSLLTQQWAKTDNVVLAVFDGTSIAYDYGGRMENLFTPATNGLQSKITNACRRLLKIHNIIKQEKPDQIISFMESSNFPTIFAAMLSGRLASLTVSVRNDPNRFTLLQRTLLPLLYRLPAKVVAVSNGVSQTLSNMGVPLRKITVIPNPVVLPGKEKIDHLTCVKRLTRGHPFLLAVGRLHKQKGFDHLLAAFATSIHKHVHLVILGEGPERENLQSQIQELSIGERVYMPGSSDELTPWYKSAECFILSSRHEGWPNVLMEAMAHGCPTISYNCNFGPDEILLGGRHGLLVEAGNIQALSNALDLLLSTSKEQRSQIGHTGHQRALQFDVSFLANKWLNK